MTERGVGDRSPKAPTYRQGYLDSAKECTVRVRTADAKAFLTVKGVAIGATRSEYEYETPFDDGKPMWTRLPRNR